MTTIAHHPRSQGCTSAGFNYNAIAGPLNQACVCCRWMALPVIRAWSRDHRGLPTGFIRTGTSIVQIRADDIAIHAFTPSDGSESAAIKVMHRHSGKEAVSNSSSSQRTNLRHAVLELVMAMNPSPDQIRAPAILLFDRVRVQLPQSFHDGQVTDLTWDYKRGEWKYFVECSETKVTNWYVAADLDLMDD